jgi:hypothetical protein
VTAAAVPEPRGRSRRSVLWFAWVAVLWVVFFALLLTDRLDAVWDWIVGLPLVAEIVVWVVFFPWVLGTFVWTRDWTDWLRLALVVLFAVGWTLVAIPRKK